MHLGDGGGEVGANEKFEWVKKFGRKKEIQLKWAEYIGDKRLKLGDK